MKTRLVYLFGLLLYIFLSTNSFAPDPQQPSLENRQARFRGLVEHSLDEGARLYKRRESLKELKSIVTKKNYNDYREIISEYREQYIGILLPENTSYSASMKSVVLNTLFKWYKSAPSKSLNESIVAICLDRGILLSLLEMDAPKSGRIKLASLEVIKYMIKDRRVEGQLRFNIVEIQRNIIDDRILFSIAKDFSFGARCEPGR